MLTDIVAKGGNLLLNVGPRGDAQLPDEQTARLFGPDQPGTSETPGTTEAPATYDNLLAEASPAML